MKFTGNIPIETMVFNSNTQNRGKEVHLCGSTQTETKEFTDNTKRQKISLTILETKV